MQHNEKKRKRKMQQKERVIEEKEFQALE